MMMAGRSGSVDIINMSVVDFRGVEVRVGDVVEDLVVVDRTIKWISKWIIVNMLGTRTHSWIIVLRIVILFLVVLVRNIRAHDHIELEFLTTISTLRQQESPWETEIGLIGVHTELPVTFQSTNNLLVQLLVTSTIILEEVVLVRVTFDHVFASLQLVLEVLELDEVKTVLADVEVPSVLIVLRSKVHPHDSFLFLLGLNVDLVGERFVVETLLTNSDLYFIVFVFLRSDEHSVAHIGVEVVEVGDKTVELDILYFNTLEVQILFGVRG